MNTALENLLKNVTDVKKDNSFAYSFRVNKKLFEKNSTKNVSIKAKKDNDGIDIIIKPNTKNEMILIPVLIDESGTNDKVYNDFYIGSNSNVTIIAGCAIRNEGKSKSSHNGIHRFYLEENAKVKYLEKHYAEGTNSHKTLDPITIIEMGINSYMEIDTVQISGVSKSDRVTKANLCDNSTLIIKEKIKTNMKEKAKSIYDINLSGKKSKCHIISRSVAGDNSCQKFISNVFGNEECYAHIECDAFIKDNASVDAIPRIKANHENSNLIHEASIGKIAGEQLLKLMTLGLTEKEAEEEIIKGFLN